MTTYTAHQIRESWTEGFRKGIIQGRIRQERESNAAKHLSYKSGYAAALRAAVEAINAMPENKYSNAVWVREAVAAIEAANIYRNDGKGEQ